MISNLEYLITNHVDLLNYPVLISILPIILGGLIYFLGKIRASNYWQYHLDNKYMPLLQGIVVINNFVFRPLVIISFFYFLIFNVKFMFTISFLSVVLLFIVLNIIQTLGKQLIKWKKEIVIENTENKLITAMNLIMEINSNWKNYLKLLLLKIIFPILTYLSIFFVLVSTDNRVIILLVSFVWLLEIMFFALVDVIAEQHKSYDLVLKDKKYKLKGVNIIEFLNDGKLIKLREANGEVKVIPIENISEIVLIRGKK